MATFAPLEPNSPAQIILAYLCHNCHVNTARALSDELSRNQSSSGLPLSGSSTSMIVTGLESGYGTRPIDRDLYTGEALDPPTSSGDAASGHTRAGTAQPEEDEVSSSRPPLSSTEVAQLKDHDGDDIMSPPPHEAEYVSISETYSPAVIVEGLEEEQFSTLDYTSTEHVEHAETNMDVQPEHTHPERAASPISYVDQEGFLEEVSRRKTIRDHVLWGRIKEATEMIQEHFPAVLRVVEVPRHSSHPFSAPLSRQPSNPLPIPSSPTVFPLSLAPDHLNLNLHIQSFIEAVRTRPLAPPPPQSAYITPHHALSLSPYGSPSPSPPPPGAAHGDAEKSIDARGITIAKTLAIMAGNLSDATDRAVYLKELDDVCALIAYATPENTAPPHVRQFLNYDRRLALADQINSAILLRTGHNPRSALEHYVRTTGVIWNSINEAEVQIPSDPKKYPPGAQPPPSRPSSRMFPLPSGRDTVVGPPFDFARFMDSR